MVVQNLEDDFITIIIAGNPITQYPGVVHSVRFGDSFGAAPREATEIGRFNILGTSINSDKFDKKIFFNQAVSKNADFSFIISKATAEGVAVINTLMNLISHIEEIINIPVIIIGNGIVVLWGVVSSIHKESTQYESDYLVSCSLVRKNISDLVNEEIEEVIEGEEPPPQNNDVVGEIAPDEDFEPLPEVDIGEGQIDFGSIPQ